MYIRHRHESLSEVVEVMVHFAEDKSKSTHLRLAVLAIIRKVGTAHTHTHTRTHTLTQGDYHLLAQELPHSLDHTLLLLHQTRVLVEGHFDTEVRSSKAIAFTSSVHIAGDLHSRNGIHTCTLCTDTLAYWLHGMQCTHSLT